MKNSIRTCAAGLLSVALLATACASQGANSKRDSSPVGPISPANVQALKLLSSTSVDGRPIGVRVSDGRVYVEMRPVGSDNVVGFSAGGTPWGTFERVCGAGPAPTRCDPAIVSSKGWPSQVIADGKLFDLSGNPAQVQAFASSCTDPTCQPLWTTTGVTGGRLGLTASGSGLIFVYQRFGGCCAGPNVGGILAFPADCGTGNATCEPAWTWGSGENGGRPVSIQAVTATGDRIYAVSGGGTLYEFGFAGTTA